MLIREISKTQVDNQFMLVVDDTILLNFLCHKKGKVLNKLNKDINNQNSSVNWPKAFGEQF